MKTYQNTVTGVEIRTECELSGENWREIDPVSSAPAESKPSKKAPAKAVKKNGDELRRAD